MYSILISLDLTIALVILMPQLGGRSYTITKLVSTSNEDGTVVNTYSTEETTTPFIEWSQGYMYNMQSIVCVVTVFVTLFGALLGIWTCLTVHTASISMEERQAALPRPLAGIGYGMVGGVTARQPVAFSNFSGKGHKLEEENIL